MRTSSSNGARFGNAFAVSQFCELLTDSALEDVFYPNSERTGGTLLGATAETHPCHPQYVESAAHRGGLLADHRNPDYDSLRRAQQHRIREHWERVEAHHIYQALSEIKHFQLARRTFDRLRQQSHEAGFRQPYAEFTFIRIAAQFVGFFKGSGGRVPQKPSKKHRDAAISRIEKLIGSMDEHGIGFDDYLRTYQLRLTLEALRVELDRPIRKPRSDEHTAFRYFNVGLTQALIRHFGAASTAIVKHLARAIDCPFDDRTIEIHVADAKARMKTAES